MRPFHYATVAPASPLATPVPPPAPAPLWLGGGTTLLDLMKLDVLRPEALVPLPPDLPTEITVRETAILLGAGVRMADAAADRGLTNAAPILAESLWKAASPQIRNMATLGGNLLQRTRCPYYRELHLA